MVTTVRDGSRARRAPAENHGSLRATSDVEHLPALRGIIDQRQIQRCAHGLRTKAPQDAGVQTQLALVTGSLPRQETLQITAFLSAGLKVDNPPCASAVDDVRKGVVWGKGVSVRVIS